MLLHDAVPCGGCHDTVDRVRKEAHGVHPGDAVTCDWCGGFMRAQVPAGPIGDLARTVADCTLMPGSAEAEGITKVAVGESLARKYGEVPTALVFNETWTDEKAVAWARLNGFARADVQVSKTDHRDHTVVPLDQSDAFTPDAIQSIVLHNGVTLVVMKKPQQQAVVAKAEPPKQEAPSITVDTLVQEIQKRAAARGVSIEKGWDVGRMLDALLATVELPPAGPVLRMSKTEVDGSIDGEDHRHDVSIQLTAADFVHRSVSRLTGISKGHCHVIDIDLETGAVKVQEEVNPYTGKTHGHVGTVVK